MIATIAGSNRVSTRNPTLAEVSLGHNAGLKPSPKILHRSFVTKMFCSSEPRCFNPATSLFDSPCPISTFHFLYVANTVLLFVSGAEVPQVRLLNAYFMVDIGTFTPAGSYITKMNNFTADLAIRVYMWFHCAHAQYARIRTTYNSAWDLPSASLKG